MPLQNIADYCMSRFDPWTSFPALECSATGKQFTYGDVRTMARQFGSQLLNSGKHALLISYPMIEVYMNNIDSFCCHRTPARGPRGHLRAELPRVRAGAAGQPGGGRHAGAHEPDARCARGGEAVLNTLLYTVLCTVQVARLLDIAQPRLVITDDGLLSVLAEAATMTATKVTLYTATCSFQDGDPPLDCRLTL